MRRDKTYTHRFSVYRDEVLGDGSTGDEVEVVLQAEFHIERGRARRSGSVYIINEDGDCYRWDDTLTDEEEEEAEVCAYENWQDAGIDSSENDEIGFIDNDFFDDDRAIHLAGRGKVYL